MNVVSLNILRCLPIKPNTAQTIIAAEYPPTRSEVGVIATARPEIANVILFIVSELTCGESDTRPKSKRPNMFVMPEMEDKCS